MSTRALRKLHGKQDLHDLSQFDADDFENETKNGELQLGSNSVMSTNKKKNKKKKGTVPMNPFELVIIRK
jgi:hypothetical protein